MFSTMYYCCLRIGEITVSGHGDHIIQLVVTRYDNSQVSFTVQFLSFKQSGSRTPSITVRCRGKDPYCPVTLLVAYLGVMRHLGGPLFVNQ